ncbi:MAG: glycosyltransferase family 9 protein [Caldimonas sp.]
MTAPAGARFGALDRLVRRGTRQPISHPVAADDAAYLARKGPLKIAFRIARRSVELAASGQRKFECERIDPAWTRALWIHAEAPQIGDALMDLAPRSLLAERGIALDLLAPATIAALFAGDRGFTRVLDDETAIEPGRYDFVVVDSRAWKALAAKRRRLPALPWLSIKGDYLGYDYHRGLLATRRLAERLGIGLDDAAERRHSRQKLWLEGGEHDGAWQEPPRVAMALGGVRAERSYAQWAEVAARLHASGVERFVLLGSANARADRDAVVQRLAGTGADVLDLVASTDLHGTWRAMRQARVVACADGGLMHLAFATSTPVVALFDSSIDPAWRVPLDAACHALRSGTRDVSAIAPDRVAAAVLDAMAAARSG